MPAYLIVLSIAAVIAGLVVMLFILFVDKPRSAGSGSIFGVPTQLFGIRESSELPEKITIWSVVVFAALVILMNNKSCYSTKQTSEIKEVIETAPPLLLPPPSAQPQQNR